MCFLKVELLEESLAVLSPKSNCPPHQDVFCFNDSLKLSFTILKNPKIVRLNSPLSKEKKLEEEIKCRKDGKERAGNRVSPH